jgi:hypothetical protein
MPTTRSTPDACTLLDADHRKVKAMFKDYDALTKSRAASASQKKRDLAKQICLELTVHAQIEEEIFYRARPSKTRTCLTRPRSSMRAPKT